MQLLDPIGVGCKLILLQFLPIGTRLRIVDHVLLLDQPNIAESLLWRKINGSSREDMSLVFTSIVRFVELYLLKENKITKNKISSENAQSENTQLKSKHKESFDDIFYDVSDIPKKYSDKCYDNLKQLAKYITTGIAILEDIYGITCAGLTLQYYINLLNSGIDGTYTKQLLPKSAQNITNENLIQPEKLKAIWKDEDIIRVTELFDNCFATRDSSPIMLEGYVTSITTILKAKDIEFRNIVGGAF